jgi:hypothetical protein
MMWAERLVPEVRGILTLAKRADQMEQTGPETWVLKGRHPDTIHAKLERWAKAEGRPVANLCSFLIERTVRDAEAAGATPITITVEGSK